jgi:hypothetical protein
VKVGGDFGCAWHSSQLAVPTSALSFPSSILDLPRSGQACEEWDHIVEVEINHHSFSFALRVGRKTHLFSSRASARWNLMAVSSSVSFLQSFPSDQGRKHSMQPLARKPFPAHHYADESFQVTDTLKRVFL